jgi:hypothetical protein
VALVNKDLLPVRLTLPGSTCDVIFLSQGLRFNMEWLLFKGPWAPFDKWHLKDDYKKINKRKELIENLQSRIAMMAACNFLLMPLILLWQILYCFYNYAELVRFDLLSLFVNFFVAPLVCLSLALFVWPSLFFSLSVPFVCLSLCYSLFLSIFLWYEL